MLDDDDGPRVPMPSSFDEDEDFFKENRMQRLFRRLKQEPLVPLGCILTVWALYGASKAMRSGDHARTNLYFRRRIYAQGFTLAAIVAGGMYWKGDRAKRQEYDRLKKEQEQADRKERWLKELEYRDEEDKLLKAERERRMAATDGKRSNTINTTSTSDPSSTHNETRSVIEQIEMRNRQIETSSILRTAWSFW